MCGCEGVTYQNLFSIRHKFFLAESRLQPSQVLSSSNFNSQNSKMAASMFKGGFVSSFHGSWGTSMVGDDYHSLLNSVPRYVTVGKPSRSSPCMKNVNEGKGLFAPAVVITRNIVGKKRFNQLRGKAIALHSQVITEFCKAIGADAKQRQGLIRLAKKNGEKLGFLA